MLPPALLGAALFWVYWPTLADLAYTWEADPQYSHGFLVPLFALYLLWLRRDAFVALTPRPSWHGVLPLALALGMLVAGGYIYSPWLTQASLLVALAGLCLALGGWGVLRAAAPALAFLAFMVPLPGRLDKALAGPLQEVATVASTNALQTLGFFAQSEGNVILLSDYELGIVGACSGLRMLMVFVATSTAVAILLERSMLQRLLIVASSVPIALVCNVLRITTTGIMHEAAGHEVANRVYHGIAGWLMPFLALGFLGLELLVFRRLFLPVAPPPDAKDALRPYLTSPGANGAVRPSLHARGAGDGAAAAPAHS
jgi:exosortase